MLMLTEMKSKPLFFVNVDIHYNLFGVPLFIADSETVVSHPHQLPSHQVLTANEIALLPWPPCLFVLMCRKAVNQPKTTYMA